MRLLIAALLLLWPLAGLAYNANGVEDRCNDLGSGCICSEPMNATLDMSVVGTYVTAGGIVDFPDTLHTGGKECGNGSNGFVYQQHTPGFTTNPNILEPANTEMSFPSGANPHVLKAHWGGTQFILLPGRDITFNNGETMCSRSYVRYRTGTVWPPAECQAPADGARIKMLILGGDTPNFYKTIYEWVGFLNGQLPSGPGNSPIIQYNYQMDGISEPHTNGGPGEPGFAVTLETCAGHWCRLEVCLDREPTFTTWAARWRITQLGSGSNVEYNHTFGPNASTNGSGSRTIGGGFGSAGPANQSLFVQCPSANWGIADPKYFVSHLMSAKVAYDTDFWIGAATELEDAPVVPPARGPFRRGAP